MEKKDQDEIEIEIKINNESDDELEQGIFEISEDEIKFIDIHSGGCFGNIFHGEFNHEEVTLRQFQTFNLGHTYQQEITEILVKEIEILAYTEKHPHLVKTFGWVFKSDAAWGLLSVEEFCPFSLHFYLQSIEDNVKISNEWKNMIYLEMAAALHQLHSYTPPIIHGNLTSHSILLTSDLHIKISNYGFLESSKLLPGLRNIDITPWKSPERIKPGIIIKESDIYSFGIVLLEIINEKEPYNKLTSIEGRIFDNELPFDINDEKINNELKNIIKDCLNNDPYERPSFEKILTDLATSGENSDDIKPNDFPFKLPINDSHLLSPLQNNKNIINNNNDNNNNINNKNLLNHDMNDGFKTAKFENLKIDLNNNNNNNNNNNQNNIKNENDNNNNKLLPIKIIIDNNEIILPTTKKIDKIYNFMLKDLKFTDDLSIIYTNLLRKNGFDDLKFIKTHINKTILINMGFLQGHVEKIMDILRREKIEETIYNSNILQKINSNDTKNSKYSKKIQPSINSSYYSLLEDNKIKKKKKKKKKKKDIPEYNEQLFNEHSNYDESEYKDLIDKDNVIDSGTDEENDIDLLSFKKGKLNPLPSSRSIGNSSIYGDQNIGLDEEINDIDNNNNNNNNIENHLNNPLADVELALENKFITLSGILTLLNQHREDSEIVAIIFAHLKTKSEEDKSFKDLLANEELLADDILELMKHYIFIDETVTISGLRCIQSICDEHLKNIELFSKQKLWDILFQGFKKWKDSNLIKYEIISLYNILIADHSQSITTILKKKIIKPIIKSLIDYKDDGDYQFEGIKFSYYIAKKSTDARNKLISNKIMEVMKNSFTNFQDDIDIILESLKLTVELIRKYPTGQNKFFKNGICENIIPTLKNYTDDLEILSNGLLALLFLSAKNEKIQRVFINSEGVDFIQLLLVAFPDNEEIQTPGNKLITIWEETNNIPVRASLLSQFGI